MSYLDKLRALVIEKGQVEVVARLGIPQSLISRWLSGKQYPSVFFIPQLSKSLDVSIESIVLDIKQGKSK